jgi:hypothetical protein
MMAIAQRMRQPVPPPVLVMIGVVALVLGVAALTSNWINSSAGPTTAPYSQFLGDIEAGRVTEVVQTGTTLEVSGPHGVYQVTVPTILTDVYGDMEHAAVAGEAAVPLFSAQPAPDTSWIGLVLTAVLPSAMILGVLALVVLLVIRPSRLAGSRTLPARLRELDEAYRAGLISDDERAHQRARILEEA